MKRYTSLLIAVLVTVAGFASAQTVPIKNGKLQGDLDANNQRIINQASTAPLFKRSERMKRVIFDHDWNDVGDSHGLKHACALADAGFWEIVALGCEYTNQFSGSYGKRFLNYYGYPNVPVGVGTNQVYVPGGNTWLAVATNSSFPYPGPSLQNSNYPSTTSVYRTALAAGASNEMIFDWEGSLRGLYSLWFSSADSASSLNGRNLCEAKVHFFFINAGRLIGTSDYEYNTEVDQGAATVVNSVTVPIVWNFINTISNVCETNFFVGQNITDVNYHPSDSPLYQLGTNLPGVCYRPGWDAFAKTFIAASGPNIVEGTNWIDGTRKFNIVGPGRVNYINVGGTNICTWSNSIPGLPSNQYYITEAGMNVDITNFVNQFIDAPPNRGGPNKMHIAQTTGPTFSGDVKVNGSSATTLSVATNALVVDSIQGRVRVGLDRGSLSGQQTNRFEINGTVATPTVGSFDWMLLAQRPVNAGVVFAQGMRMGISRSKSVTSFSADTLIRFQLISAASVTDETAAWTTWMDVSTNVVFGLPVKVPAGTVSDVSFGLSGHNDTGIFFPAVNAVSLVAGGTEALRGFGGDTYQASGGRLFWVSGALGGSSSDVGLGRNAAGVLEINLGSGSGFGDLVARTLTTTNLNVRATITAGGTTGARTIDQSAGTVNIAAAGTSVVVTCNKCTTSSLIFATIRSNDTTSTIKNVVAGSGSFTITLNAAATAETSVGFFIVTPN